MQGHAVFALAPEGSMVLPGLVEEKRSGRAKSGDEEKMKIAWRYERLGAFQEERERGMFDIYYSFSSWKIRSFLSVSACGYSCLIWR